jgi:D-glycero-D-manno-heptose 1,7-bisphosphate phosphatase
MSQVRQAVFLVGGKGTRLGEISRLVPKPLLEVAPGLRFLDIVIEDAARHGLTDIILLAGHLGDVVAEAYHGRVVRGAQVRVIREPSPQGTGGALLFAADVLDPWFVMANGDSLFEINWRALAAPLPPGALGRLALREVPDPARYGAVELDGDRITGFAEKSPELSGPRLINGGIYLLSREVLGCVPGPCSIEQDVFPALAQRGQLLGMAFDGYFLDIGLPDTYSQACAELPGRRIRPLALMDRDGVLNVDHGYTHASEDLVWQPQAREAIRLLNDSGYVVAVVTNQAGIARGYYTVADMEAFHARMQLELAQIGAHIDAFYFCPYHPEASVIQYQAADHPDRKPNPGMLLAAMQDWPCDISRSFLVGDQPTDLEAARRAGVVGHHYTGGSLLDVIRQALATADAGPHGSTGVSPQLTAP